MLIFWIRDIFLIQPNNSPTSLYNYVVLNDEKNEVTIQSYHLPYLGIGDNSNSLGKANYCIGKEFFMQLGYCPIRFISGPKNSLFLSLFLRQD